MILRFKKKNKIEKLFGDFYFMYMGVLPLGMSMHHMHALCVSTGARRRLQTFWNWSYISL